MMRRTASKRGPHRWVNFAAARTVGGNHREVGSRVPSHKHQVLVHQQASPQVLSVPTTCGRSDGFVKRADPVAAGGGRLAPDSGLRTRSRRHLQIWMHERVRSNWQSHSLFERDYQPPNLAAPGGKRTDQICKLATEDSV